MNHMKNASTTHAQFAFWSSFTRSSTLPPTIPMRNQMPIAAPTNISVWRRDTRRIS